MAFFGFKDFDRLSEVDMDIYRFFTANVAKVPYLRVRDIAQEAHVSNSSVMRFIHKLGYDSFPEFKISFRSEQQRSKTNDHEINFITAENFPPDIYEKIKLVANEMQRSDQVIYCGMGSSGALAEYATRQTAAVGFNSFCVKDPFYPLITQLKNTSNNLLITFSVSGKTIELIEMLNNFVHNEDVTLVAITADPSSQLALMSRYTLCYSTDQQRLAKYYDLTTQIPAMYLIEQLISTARRLAVEQNYESI
jgi:Transcriptional regulators